MAPDYFLYLRLLSCVPFLLLALPLYQGFHLKDHQTREQVWRREQKLSQDRFTETTTERMPAARRSKPGHLVQRKGMTFTKFQEKELGRGYIYLDRAYPE